MSGPGTWQALRDEALRRIRARDWPPGARIPDEADLALEWGCARATVNRALRDLAEAGYLERRRKGGTRVALAPVRRAVFHIPLIRQDIAARGLEPGYRLLEDRMADPPAAVQAVLGPGPLRHLRALHLADGAVWCLEDRWLAPGIAGGVGFESLSANEWLVANVAFSEGTLSFSAQAAEGELAALLGCAPGAALLVLERVTRGPGVGVADTGAGGVPGGMPVTCVRLVHAPGHRVEAAI